MQQKTTQLHAKEASVEFYETCYSSGYNPLEGISVEKKQRILEFIRSLDLPKSGEALDFGCGRGVMTEIIRQALPGWKVFGMDLSATAVANARKNFPKCIFFCASDEEFLRKKFDFIFSHHVLEHVYNLSIVLGEIHGQLKEKAGILHILPSGNEGSLEHTICLLRKDGINPYLGNRFFFEDESHIRRLTSKQFIKLYEERGFKLVTEAYSHQYEGSMEWFTMAANNHIFIRHLTNPSQAIDSAARKQLRKLRFKLLGIWALRYFAVLFEKKLRKEAKKVKDYFHLICGFPIYLLAKPVDWNRRYLAQQEWQLRKNDRNGSEMYLYFKKAIGV